MKKLLYAALSMVMTFGPAPVLAQWPGPDVPDSLSFQGFLADDSGVPIDDAVDMTFKLYKGPNEIWSQTKSGVVVTDGVFNVILGGIGTSSLDTVAFNRQIDLGIKVGADPEISPRTPLTSVAYALGMRGMYAVRASDGNFNEGVNVMGGAATNNVGADVVGATISGGGGINSGQPLPNSVIDDFGTVGGGSGNSASKFGTVGGGQSNTASGEEATVGGGRNNTADGLRATVGGGEINTASGLYATVPGGRIGQAGGDYATVGGGLSNSADSFAATVGGGSNNTANGLYATVAGGRLNRARGGYSFVAGRRAKADHGGTFVWADSTPNADLVSTGPDQFLIRAAGGVGIGTNAPAAPLDVKGGNWDFSTGEGDVRIGNSTERLKIGIATVGDGAGIARINAVGTTPHIYLGTNNVDIVAVSPTAFVPNTDDATSLGTSANVWTEVWATDGAINMSDRRLKQDIREAPYGLREILQLLPVTYRWRNHPEKGDKIGLIAQDVDSVIPEIVRHGETPDEMLGINYAELVPVLIKAIQEQQATIVSQSERIDLQGEQIADLHREIYVSAEREGKSLNQWITDQLVHNDF